LPQGFTLAYFSNIQVVDLLTLERERERDIYIYLYIMGIFSQDLGLGTLEIYHGDIFQRSGQIFRKTALTIT